MAKKADETSWLDDMDAEVFIPESRRRQSKGQAERDSELLPKMDLPPITPEAVDKKVKEYLQDFDESTITRIDISQLTNLARLSLNIEALNTALSRAPEGIYTAGQVRTIASSLKDMMVEERQQAEALAISRSKRITGQQSELELYLPKLKKQTRDLMGDRVILIMCDKCIKGTAIEGDKAKVDIRQGMLLYHFSKENKDWEWSGKCMRCGNQISITHKNYTKYLLKEWDKPIVLSKEKVDQMNAEINDEELDVDQTESL